MMRSPYHRVKIPLPSSGADRSSAWHWGGILEMTSSCSATLKTSGSLIFFGTCIPLRVLCGHLWGCCCFISRKVLLHILTILHTVLGGLWTPWNLVVGSIDRNSWCTGHRRMPNISQGFSSPEMLVICPPKALQCPCPYGGEMDNLFLFSI